MGVSQTDVERMCNTLYRLIKVRERDAERGKQDGFKAHNKIVLVQGSERVLG